MIKKKITNFELGTLNYFLTRAFFIGVTFSCIIKIIKQDGWITPIISIFTGIIIILLISYIADYKPDLPLPDKLNCLFNKSMGSFLTIIIMLIAFFYSITNYLNLNNFIHNQFLNKTPIIVIAIMFTIVMYYVIIKGINTITKTSVILFYIGIVIIIFTIINLIPTLEISNIKPLFQFNSEKLIKSLEFYYAFHISPMLILTIIPKNSIKNPKIKKTLIISFILSCITLFSVIFLTLSTFGYELTILYEYPEFYVLKNISLIGLSSRIESILVIQWLFDLLIFSLLYIYFISQSIKKLVKKKDLNVNLIYTIYCIILIVMVVFLSRFNIYIDNIILKYIYQPITIITILIIILICIKIKFSKKLLKN